MFIMYMYIMYMFIMFMFIMFIMYMPVASRAHRLIAMQGMLEAVRID